MLLRSLLRPFPLMIQSFASRFLIHHLDGSSMISTHIRIRLIDSGCLSFARSISCVIAGRSAVLVVAVAQHIDLQVRFQIYACVDLRMLRFQKSDFFAQLLNLNFMLIIQLFDILRATVVDLTI